MIKKPIIYKNKKHLDKRGFFQEIYLKKKFGIKVVFSAVAYSKKNVIRGLHFQSPIKQTKIIHVIKGKIMDVAVNIDKNSKSLGKVFKFKLSEGDTIIIPNNYAHGYECLSKECIILYHLDNYRDIKSENGITYNDKQLNIRWNSKRPILSKRDKLGNSFIDFKKKFNKI